MRRNVLGYDDAVKLLGGECKVVSALSNLAGLTLTGLSVGGAPTALSLFALKDEVARLSQEAVKVLRRRLTKTNRFERTELLEAAHAVLVVSAFFAALDDIDRDLGTALNSASMELTKSEQASIASNSTANSTALGELVSMLIIPGGIPGLEAGLVESGQQLKRYYVLLGSRLNDFARGTSVWDERDATIKGKWSAALIKTLPAKAIRRYEGQLTQLSGDFPEFAFWAHRVGIQIVLDKLNASRKSSTEIGATLQTATKLLATAASGSDPEKIRADLVRRYRDQIAKPIAGVAMGSTPGDVKLPSLAELYITPSYRMMISLPGRIEQITEPGWEKVQSHTDLGAKVLEHLISTRAAQVPLVLLGQPGAGKSVFSQMLAAELDPRDYLVVRVELRAVPSDTGVQEQIEAALITLTGRSIPWPTLAETAGKAQPVIILDGFDELLQASGFSHFDYLERVQAFQEREFELGRPVAVLVTSRTAVADQVRYPVNTPVVRLEQFDDGQVERWLAVWNRANPIRPLTPGTALQQAALATQPLLLFMLALFHSGGGDLTSSISQAHLFERLFTSFVERDIDKLDKQLTDKERQQLVQRDLDTLSMVAFSMFNRGRQSITEGDLITDLTALVPERSDLIGQNARQTALSIAERMAGRFFFRLFMHKDEAMRGQQAMLTTYEFLHASFAEFLVGRWVVKELSRLADQFRRASDDPYPSGPDDAKLHAMLSMTVLSTREQRVLSFMEPLLIEKRPSELTELRKLTITLLHTSLRPRSHNPYPQYRPSTQTAPAAYASYSANLVLLTLLVSEAVGSKSKRAGADSVPVSEFQLASNASQPQASELASFYAMTRLWHAQLTRSEWDSLVDVVRVRARQVPNRQTIDQGLKYALSLWRPPTNRDEPISGYEVLRGFDFSKPMIDDYVEWGSPTERAFREAALLGATGYQGACRALLPYLSVLDTEWAEGIFESRDDLAACLLALLIPMPQTASGRRSALYAELFSRDQGTCAARLIFGRLRDDIPYLTEAELIQIATQAVPYAWAHITAYLDIIAQINRLKNPETDTNGTQIERSMRYKLFEPFRGNIGKGRGRTRYGQFAWKKLADNIMGLSWHDHLALLDPYKLIRVPDRYNPDGRSLFAFLRIETPADVIALISLRDFFGLMTVQDLANLYDSSAVVVQGTSERGDWREWSNSPILRVALWTAVVSRRLPMEGPPPCLTVLEWERLEAIAPAFVALTRKLAAERGISELVLED